MSLARRRRWHYLRDWLCDHGLHWRITFSYEAVPAYLGEDPTPPEEGWCCNWCGDLHEPYSWPLRARTVWRVKNWWYERPGGRFDRDYAAASSEERA